MLIHLAMWFFWHGDDKMRFQYVLANKIRIKIIRARNSMIGYKIYS